MLNKIKNRFNNKKGFTLVELIVVIVIILILAAVLVPNVTKYVSNARTASVKSDASAILTQLQADCTAYAAGSELGTSEFETKVGESYTISGKTVKCVSSVTETADGGIQYKIEDNQISVFVYADGKHFIKWTLANGWGNVDNAS